MALEALGRRDLFIKLNLSSAFRSTDPFHFNFRKFVDSKSSLKENIQFTSSQTIKNNFPRNFPQKKQILPWAIDKCTQKQSITYLDTENSLPKKAHK